MTSPLAAPQKSDSKIRKVAIVFAGGPAPAANAVISTAASSFINNKIEVIGILYGYSGLVKFGPEHPMVEGRDFMRIRPESLRRTRNSQGILIGTARTNPGVDVSHPDHLNDEERCGPLRRVYEALCSLEVDALISIGGDDTLKTANKMKLYQDGLPADKRRMPVVHVPKTIDNDYHGIDFTFGYFTAVDFLAQEIRNLLHDAEASRAYFLTECMGRSAGWLSYGAAIAGEASYVVSVEDIVGQYRAEEVTKDPQTGVESTRVVMNVEKVVNRIVKSMVARDSHGKEFGVIVMAEGLAEYLPAKHLEGIPRDDHGHISISHINLGRMFSRLVMEAYTKATNGKKRKVTGVQLGYESRCAKPHAFDVMLGSQLGVGSYRALVEQNLNGVLVSIKGQMDLNYVPFDELIDPATLVTKVRDIQPGCDLHRLARFLETNVNE